VRCRSLLVVVAALAGGAGCGDPPLKAGVVVDRELTPAHTEHYTATHYRTETYTEWETVCHGYGEYRSCGTEPVTRTRQVPYYVQESRWVEDDFDLELRSCETKDGKERCRTGRVDVSRDTYEQCAVGRRYREETKCTPR
jgi:hypothetical protein